MKTKIKTIGLVVVGAMLGASLVLTPYFLLAQTSGGSGGSGTPADINSNLDCQKALQPIVAKEEKSYREFIEQTFKNKSDASALVDTAVARYGQMRKNLLGEIDKYQSKSGQDLTVTLQQILTCKKMVDDSLATAEALLKKHVLSNAQAKKTTKLVIKLKEINEKLGKLQREVGYMQGYMTAFSKQLPCFTKQCL